LDLFFQVVEVLADWEYLDGHDITSFLVEGLEDLPEAALA